jgi:hypothetical protein
MTQAALLHGAPEGILAALPAALAAAGFTLGTDAPASLLVNCGGTAEAAIGAAQQFAAAARPAEDSLVVTILRAHAPGDWPAAQAAASLWAFTRYAALAWAPLLVRVNAVGLGVSPVLYDEAPEAAGRAAGAVAAAAATPEDVAATILAMWRFRSMTGQLIRLGA